MDSAANIAQLKSELQKLDAKAIALEAKLETATETDKDRIITLLGMVNTQQTNIRQEIIAYVNSSKPTHPSVDIQRTTMSHVFRLQMVLRGFRTFGGVRRSIISAAKAADALGKITPLETDSNRNDLVVDCFFPTRANRNAFLESVNQHCIFRSELSVTDPTFTTECPPSNVDELPRYKRADSSPEDVSSVESKTSHVTSIAHLPEESANLGTVPRADEVIHIVPKALFRVMKLRDTNPPPWAVIGGSPYLNKLSDATIPRVSICGILTQRGPESSLVELTLTCFDAADFRGMCCALPQDFLTRRSLSVTGPVAVATAIVDPFLQALQWRERCRALAAENPTQVGNINGKEKGLDGAPLLPWYRLSPLPQELQVLLDSRTSLQPAAEQ